ncbi:AMMECR1 protein [Pelomyxa schiedti]|nr:AMMECR1 protein [Pelomyxa schiedti]
MTAVGGTPSTTTSASASTPSVTPSYASVVSNGAHPGSASWVPSEQQKRFLVDMVREAAQGFLDRKKAKGAVTDHTYWTSAARELGLDFRCGGVFVTYETRGGDLRGCIGQFNPDEPLYQVVLSRALSAVTDSRFTWDPITASEFRNSINITVSILTPPVTIKNPLEEVKVGVHGIIVSKDGHRGTYLPEVATENNWDVKTFVTHCANRKAGISGDVLRDPGVHWETYTTIAISEKDLH